MKRLNNVTAWMTAIVLASLGLGVAYAQRPARAEDDGDASEETAPQTPQDRLAEGAAVSEQAAQLTRGIAGLLDEARDAGDIIRVTCLNDKLAQANATASTVEERLGFLEEATTQSDEGRADHESTMLAVLGQKLDVLEAEASECVGQNLFETGETVVTVDIDPANPTEDPNVVPVAFEYPIPYFPPPASGVI